MSKNKPAGRGQPAKRTKLAELRREINYSRFNRTRAEKEWKQICMNIAVPRLREEMINCWHYLERIIDTKDFVISLYMDEIRQHEDLYEMNIQNHQHNIQKLMLAFSRKVQDIHMGNNECLMDMIRRSFEDWENQANRADVSENLVKMMRFGLEAVRKRWSKTAKTENFARINEESTKHTHNVQELSFGLELKLEDLWNRMRFTEEDFCQRIQENKKHHDIIKETDEATNRTVQKELKKLMNLQVLAKRLASKFKELVNTIGIDLKYLEDERDSLDELQFALRNKLMQNKDNDTLKRTLMTIEFGKAFDNLNAKLKKGNSLMMVLKGTHRFERCCEKILPYPVRGYDVESNKEFSVPQLRLFWQRVAEADVYRYTLNEERIFLKAENKNLRKQIHSYCKCLKCPMLPQIPVRVGRIPYTEGREMIQKQKTQNRRRN